jgi:hydrogenase expression/formation protein HypE
VKNVGKLGREELRKLLTCIKPDPRVVVPPQVGFDAGVHRLGDKLVAVATDPCIGVPESWFGFLLVNYAASDVALFGAKPEFCTITLMGPPATAPAEFRQIMRQTCSAADDLGVAIVRGHTATYDGIQELAGVCTVYGIVEPTRLITPANAEPDDLIVCTKPIGLETAINFALTRKELARQIFGYQTTQHLATLVPLQSCVKEALCLAQIRGVHAMHDATEGGLIAAVNELSEASGLGFEVEFDKVPFAQEAKALQKSFGLSDAEAMAMSSTGTILTAIQPKAEEQVAAEMATLGLKSTVIGTLTQNRNRLLTKKGKKEPFPQATEDPYAKMMAATS